MNCLECADKYTFDPITKKCISCPSGCANCSVGTYDTDTGMCLATVSSETSEATKVGAALGGVLGAVTAVSIIAVIVICMKLKGIQKALSRLSIPNGASPSIPQPTHDPEISPLKGNHTKVHPADSKQIGQGGVEGI